ncbi:MAG: AbrB/MazE/SpoVT family DNA-binding domain-containing protein [Candidatus Nitrosocaldus sp.]|nr:AbrB/MazE/SpoVT family DNA-binding domain-containing protein [Candidatus Nitrosocaldus sp.]MDW8000997.1 AbrB/MazE/SpoVT family DNA-binding domain-containing protein [Candidatus Nitrosocaldus sp.]
MTIRLKVGRKGYIILPKAVREPAGIDEGDELIVEVRDGIVLKPVRSVNSERLRVALKEHVKRLSTLKSRREPEQGALISTYLKEYEDVEEEGVGGGARG